MAKKAPKAKEPIRLREKKLSNGNISLYLDYYREGKRKYEFLKLYLIPEKSDASARERNKQTIIQANAIKSQRILEVTNDEAGLRTDRTKMLLVDYLTAYQEESSDNEVKKSNIGILISLISDYNPNVRLKDLDRDFCIGFTDYLSNTYRTKDGRKLAPVSVKNRLVTLQTAINSAVRKDILRKNPFSSLSPSEKVRVPESQRVYLTLDEVRLLEGTECSNAKVKQAFLFSCYCGLRISDIRMLTWSNIESVNGRTQITIVQKKTQEPLRFTLSNKALSYLPQRNGKGNDEPVFDLTSLVNIDKNLHRWAKSAGLTKAVSFHTARHTFATSLLTLGADLYTTSKLLGHTNIATTQIYAKIVDKKKEEAMSLFDKAFDNDNK